MRMEIDLLVICKVTKIDFFVILQPLLTPAVSR